MPTVRLIFTHDELHYRFGELAAVAQEEALKPQELLPAPLALWPDIVHPSVSPLPTA